MGLFDPAWLKKIPANLRPDSFKVKELENLRRQFNIPHDAFPTFVMQSPGITKMIFEQQFVAYKKKDLRATNQEVFEAILQLRQFTNNISNGMTPEAARESLQQSWKLAAIKSAVEKIHTIDELARYVTEEEGFWDNTPDPYHINTRIAEILGYSH
jgi:hypothetical protein